MEKLTKLKSFILGTNFALLAFVAYTAKTLTISTNVADALVLFCLAGLYGYDKYLSTKRIVPINDAVIQELNNVKAIIQGMKLEKSSVRKDVKYF